MPSVVTMTRSVVEQTAYFEMRSGRVRRDVLLRRVWAAGYDELLAHRCFVWFAAPVNEVAQPLKELGH